MSWRRWEHHVVEGTLIREKYVKSTHKEMWRNGGLSERFYVACKIKGLIGDSEVRVTLLVEEDAKRIFEEAKAKDGKYPEEGIPVEAQIIRHSKLSDRDQYESDYKKNGRRIFEFRDHRFIVTSLVEDDYSPSFQ